MSFRIYNKFKNEVNSEHNEQVKLFKNLKNLSVQYPQLNLIFAIPNGGARNKITARNLKLEGVKAGVPDIFIPIPQNQYSGMFIELKKKGNYLRKEQKNFIEELLKLNYNCVVCYSAKDALVAIQEYLNINLI